MPEGYRLHGNTAATMSASMTLGSLELNQWHEMEATVHSQFGTVDNPVLIFTSDSSWRVVICMGPGIEDDSNSHEKIFYMVREGPINRCQICGQCFKIVRLKDEFTELQDYYSLMFASISHFETAEEDLAINMTSMFNDRPQATMQTIPATNVYIHVNSDEADRILVDPAYKLERLTEAQQGLYAMHAAYKAVDEQLDKHRTYFKVPFGRDTYETWYGIEKAIYKLDRLFNKVEKFDARKFSDPENHERREKRMLENKRKRWSENYTYFFGGLTEEEQQYRDYFQTDIENDPEDGYVEDQIDELRIANDSDFDIKRYDFLETSMQFEVIENFEDIVEDKIFKYKYKMNSDDAVTYNRRMNRLLTRFAERAAKRDPIMEESLIDLYKRDEKDTSLAQVLLDPENFNTTALEGTRAAREYMAQEGVQQYRDYYESDAEEQGFFEYLDNIGNRDRLRFLEIYEDFTVNRFEGKEYKLIPKREFNPELSAFSNLILDLQDFRDRVKPLARDIALHDVSRKYQKENINTLIQEQKEFYAEQLAE